MSRTDAAAPAATPAAQASPTTRVRWRPLLAPAGIFLASRFLVLVTAWCVRILDPSMGYGHILANWDGNWNTIIATNGYASLPAASSLIPDVNQPLAFLPALPLSTRAIHLVTGLPVRFVGVTLATAASLGAIILLHRLVSDRWGERAATRTVLLVAFAPYGFVLSMFYTEGYLLLAAVCCLLALERRWWWAAGFAALIGGICRPNGFLLAIPCLIVAVREWRREGSWRPLVAPALAPLGFLAWLGYVWHRTGSPTGYFDLQDVGWGARLDFGRTTWDSLWATAHGWTDQPEQVMTVVMCGLGIVGIVLMVRQRMPSEWTAYCIAAVALIVLSARQASAGRYLLTAFPIAVAYARAVPERAFPSVVAVSGGVASALLIVSSLGGGISP